MALKKKDIEQFKERLLAKRAAIVGDANHLESEAAHKAKVDNATLDISNFADLGSDNYAQEFDLGVLEQQGDTLRAIDEALERIEEGSFGLCDICGKAIPKGRLMAKPDATACVSCLNEQEESGS
ncbi:MAG: TraR/DksA family transcriptional regulator [Planctomycetota bacterium]